MSLYCTGNSRSPEQTRRMEALEAAGTCLFCPGTVDADTDRVVLRDPDWIVRYNDFPYAGTRLHLLVVPRRHVTDLLDLPDDELAGFWRVGRTLRDRFDLDFYGLGARCGDCRFTGGTIAHVHVHLVVGDVEDPDHTPVRLKLSSRPAPGPAPGPLPAPGPVPRR